MRHIPHLLLVYLLVLYFDFVPQTYLLRSTGEIYIDLYHKVPATHMSKLKVRALTNVGLVYLLNTESNAWIYSGEFWTRQPPISSSLKLKVKSAFSPIQLRLEILDTTTGTLYTTLSKKFWTKDQLTPPKLDVNKY